MSATINAMESQVTPAWIGMDVAKKTFEAALILPHQRDLPLRDLPARSFERTPEGVQELLLWTQRLAPAHALRVVMESTGNYSLELAQWLITRNAELRPAIVNPSFVLHFARSLGARNKTDRTDARILALFGLERRPAPWENAPEHLIQLRALVRERDALVQTATAHKARHNEGSESAIVLKLQAQLIKQIQTSIKKLEAAIKKLLATHAQLKTDMDLLDSIPGVGLINAASILSELGDLRRFERSRQVAAFAGVCPRRNESGTSVHKRTRMSKKGNPRARRSLYLSAMTVVRGDNPLARHYQKLIAGGHEPISALGAIMRKILVLMRSILISGKPYDPNFKSCEQTNASWGERCEQIHLSTP